MTTVKVFNNQEEFILWKNEIEKKQHISTFCIKQWLQEDCNSLCFIIVVGQETKDVLKPPRDLENAKGGVTLTITVHPI